MEAQLAVISNEESQEPELLPHVREAIELYKAKKSLTEIGQAIGKSRGAVAGIIYRARQNRLLGDHPIDTARLKKPKGKRVSMPQIARQITPASIAAVIQTTKRVRLRLIESPTAVTFQELEPHHCKWPQGDPKRPDFRFCGCRRQLGSPYCEEHTVIGLAPPYKRVR